MEAQFRGKLTGALYEASGDIFFRGSDENGRFYSNIRVDDILKEKFWLSRRFGVNVEIIFHEEELK